VMFTGLLLVGLFGGMMVGMQAFLMPRIFGEHVVGKAFGLMSSVTMLALMAAPSLFGLIYDRTGSYAAIFYAFAVLALAAMLAVMAMRLHPRRTVPEGELAAVPAE
jgi:MFS family permease